MMKNKIFLPVEPDGSLHIPAVLVEHLGIRSSDLLAVNLPAQASCCIDCEELELNLSTGCEENLCNGYTSHEEVVNLPQELLDIADIPAGAELYAVCIYGSLMFITEDSLPDIEMMVTAMDADAFILPLSEFSECND